MFKLHDNYNDYAYGDNRVVYDNLHDVTTFPTFPFYTYVSYRLHKIHDLINSANKYDIVVIT